MKYMIAVISFALAVPTTAQAASLTPAQAFARAWIDPESTADSAHAANQEKLQRCIRAGYMSQQQIDANRSRLALYEKTYVDGLGQVQEKIARGAADLLSTSDLRQIATTFASPAFRQMRKEGLAGMAQTIAPNIPGCGDNSRPMNLTQLGATARKRLRPDEVAKFRTFAFSPAGQHFSAVLPQLTPMMMQAMREDVIHAMEVAGASEAAQNEVRKAPDLITDNPITATPAP